MTASGEFFIGWSSSPGPRTRRFLVGVALAVLGAAAALALGLGAAAEDPAGRGFAEAPGAGPGLPAGEASLAGTLTLLPSPLLHLPPDPAHPRGRAVLLAEEGKRGATIDPALEGRAVRASGYILARGDLAMLVLGAAPEPLAETLPPPRIEQLGRWRIRGEICDGKCASGGMRPGTALGHRACAVLCLDGALPAVFVAEAPLAGSAFLLLGGAAGPGLPPGLRPLVGLRVTLTGAVERRGDMLVLLADPP